MEDIEFRDLARRFADEYLIDLDGRKALERCGIKSPSGKMVRRMLSDPDVRELIEQRMEERSYRTSITADAVLERLWLEARGMVGDTLSTARVRALELIGKHVGLFDERGDMGKVDVVEVVIKADGEHAGHGGSGGKGQEEAVQPSSGTGASLGLPGEVCSGAGGDSGGQDELRSRVDGEGDEIEGTGGLPDSDSDV